ncbi:hypothetical protein RKE29_13210 [Streptomyces sp. B1866]|uniref:hypothetical protein n=1 Tax=Streptomyces sp. B1866 TaxID=3075431 RepID=UPI00288E8AA1|nr:hypothetical protein [Streptomyces sp. B1866]MDT3397598.1 hypothetical protein [Streptomyces sp. B1866]
MTTPTPRLTARPTARRTLARRACAVAAATAAAVVLAACGSGDPSSGHAGHNAHGAGPKPSASAHHHGMDGMDGAHGGASGTGLSDAAQGYRLTSPTTTLPAGKPSSYRFTVTGPGGRPVTAFVPEQTRRMHVYAIRSDLTGFQHVHPTMGGDGTWSAPLAALTPGRWRLFASFTPDTGRGENPDLVLSRQLTVAGTAAATPLPAPAATTTADGYTLTLSGDLTARMAHPLTVTVTRNGRPVTDLEPYLGTYAHLTAFHEGDSAFAHLHPTGTAEKGRGGGPELAFHAELPAAGNWRLFLQFQTGGTLHTAAVTLRAG